MYVEHLYIFFVGMFIHVLCPLKKSHCLLFDIELYWGKLDRGVRLEPESRHISQLCTELWGHGSESGLCSGKLCSSRSPFGREVILALCPEGSPGRESTGDCFKMLSPWMWSYPNDVGAVTQKLLHVVDLVITSTALWWSRMMCAYLLLWELQNYTPQLNNHQQENVGSHKKRYLKDKEDPERW